MVHKKEQKSSRGQRVPWHTVDTRSAPASQRQQRRSGQPWESNRHIQLQEENCLLVIFHNITDISTYNAFVIWYEPGPQARGTGGGEAWKVTPSRHSSFSSIGKGIEPGPDLQLAQEENERGQKRRRWNFCPAEKDCKTGTKSCKCGNVPRM